MAERGDSAKPVSEDRKRMLAARSIGPRMLDHLEAIGITRLEQLRAADAREIAWRIDLMLGAPRMNAAGIAALQNLIDLAESEA
jgi:predicted flap endonuclease-1-like 5' DNA nuclease